MKDQPTPMGDQLIPVGTDYLNGDQPTPSMQNSAPDAPPSPRVAPLPTGGTGWGLQHVPSPGTGLLARLLAGCTTGAVAVTCAQPTDVVKVRFQALGALPESNRRYSGTVDAYRTIAREEGVRGLWRGRLWDGRWKWNGMEEEMVRKVGGMGWHGMSVGME